MSNEWIFLISVVIELCVVLLFYKWGKSALVATIVVNAILVSTFGAKLIPIFGYVTNAANVYYAMIFVAANLVTERYGAKEGFKSIWIGFFSLLLFIIMGQFALAFVGHQNTQVVNEAIRNLFGIVPRVAFASMFAYLVVQNFNVWLFEILHKKSGSKYLWFRNLFSTIIAQFFDSIIFFFIAFYGSIPNGVLIETMYVGFVLKVLIALMSTPFVFRANTIVPIDETPVKLEEQKEIELEKPSKLVAADKIILVKIISLVVIIIGILVMGGWWFNIPVLTTLIPGLQTSMKFSTAASFVFSGIALYFICENLTGKKDLASVVLPISTLIVALFMVTLLISVVLGVNTGVEKIFVGGPLTFGNRFVPGLPSLGTTVEFVLIVISILVSLYNPKKISLVYRILGLMLALLSGIALVGYVIRNQYLYYLIPNISNGMAVHTAILFCLIGFGLWRLGREKLVAEKD